MLEYHQTELARMPVSVERLDDVLTGIEGTVLIKIDTETTEPDVLAGAQALIQRHRPTVLVEVLEGFDTGPEIQALLAGYTAHLLTDEGPVKAEQIRGHSKWRNYLMLPA